MVAGANAMTGQWRPLAAARSALLWQSESHHGSRQRFVAGMANAKRSFVAPARFQSSKLACPEWLSVSRGLRGCDHLIILRCLSSGPQHHIPVDGKALAFVRQRVADSAAASAGRIGSSSSSAALAPVADGSEAASEPSADALLPAWDLPNAARALDGKAADSGEATRLRRLLAKSLEAAMPELLQSGECVALVLKMPLTKFMERPLKRLVLRLSHWLRGHKRWNGTVSLMELPHIPRLLQRIGLQDNRFFADFCLLCAEQWPNLPEGNLSLLLRNTEDYNLLHAQQGPALRQLVLALESNLVDTEATDRAVSNPALATLCSALIAVRQRGHCRELLERLRNIIQKRSTEPELKSDGLDLLLCAVELHRAIGMSQETLQRLLNDGPKNLASSSATDDRKMKVLKVVGYCHWLQPDATCAAFDALLAALDLKGNVTPTAQVCRHAPAALRYRLAFRLVQNRQVAELVEKFSMEDARNWLMLVHDLHAHSEHLTEIVPVAFALLEKLLGSETKDVGLDSSASPSELAGAYLAASSMGCRLPQDLSEAPSFPSAEAFGHLAERARSRLEQHWPQMGPRDVQTIFRSPGDCRALARGMLQNLDQFRDFRTRLSVLNLATAALPGEDTATNWDALMQVEPHRKVTAAELCAREAAVRRGCGSVGSGLDWEARSKTMVALRQGAFQAVLQEDATWSQRPPRGFFQYVEQCLGRSRGELPVPGAPTPGAPTQEQGTSAAKTTLTPTADIAVPEQLPTERCKGVTWHKGMEGWEVRVEARGRSILGGYFLPEEETDEAVERARLDAVEHHQHLKQVHLRR